MTQNTLANAYSSRIRGEKADNIERAIGLCEAALEVHTRDAFPYEWARTQHNLAIAYRNRIRGETADNIERAIGLCEAVLEVRTCAALPREHLETAGSLGQVLLRAKAWRRASDVFEDARETFRLLLGEGLDETEARGLIAAAGPLFSCASFAAAEHGEAERAFALACEGKARLLATALRLQRLDLPPDKSAHLAPLRTEIREQSRLLQRVEGMERAGVLDRLARLRGELAGLIALSEARTGRGDALAQAGRICADGGIVVAPILTEIGGKVFIVTPTQDRMRPALDIIDLPELTTERLKLLMRGDAGGHAGGWLSGFARDVAWHESKTRMTRAIENIGEQLWSLLAGPLERVLAGLGVAPQARLVFLPSAGFGLLPLGLAEEPKSGRRLIESREIVYAPSLDAIDTPAPATEPASLAAIVNPTGDLIHTPLEGAFVAAHFHERNRILLDAHTARPDAALASLKGRSHWHFATHGLFDLDEARRSKLAMAEGTYLSVGDLLEAEDLGRPRLVVLSACETGLHDIAQTPEEFIGFPGAFMTMGAQAVLGTLWPVDDCASTLLTARFYDGHLRDGLAPATALRQAQLWLRSATRDDLSAYAREAAHRSNVEAGALRSLEGALEGAAAEMDRFFAAAAVEKDGAGAPPSSRPRDKSEPGRPFFAHPIYWGGFVMTGR
jgi:CHAT domain-containing protein